MFLIIYASIFLFYLIRRRRLFFDIIEQDWLHFTNIGEVLFTGYLIHFLPFLFVERTLFLHHYLPAFVFKVLLSAATIEHIHYLIR